MHKGLKEAGLRFEKKGSGGIVFVGDMAVKAYSIDRQFSMGKLCKRPGEFIAGYYSTSMPKIESERVSKIAEEQWREYQKIRFDEIEAHKSQKAEILKQNENVERCYLERIAPVTAISSSHICAYFCVMFMVQISVGRVLS